VVRRFSRSENRAGTNPSLRRSSRREDVMGAWFRMCQDALEGTKYGTQVRLQQTIFSLCSTLPDSQDFFDLGLKKSLGKLLYKDCVWNLETAAREPFNPEYYFTVSIPRNHVDVRDERVYQVS